MDLFTAWILVVIGVWCLWHGLTLIGLLLRLMVGVTGCLWAGALDAYSRQIERRKEEGAMSRPARHSRAMDLSYFERG
jgi:hypothetical protein